MWQDYVNALLGAALIVVAYLDLSAASLVWTLSTMGVVILVLGMWGGARTIA